jgi:hypothetical protein
MNPIRTISKNTMNSQSKSKKMLRKYQIILISLVFNNESKLITYYINKIRNKTIIRMLHIIELFEAAGINQYADLEHITRVY